MQTPTIIDIEASGFGSNSYPIEIGVIRADGARFCKLIRPLESWTHWEDEAQGLHGLSREHLNHFGNSISDVCNELNDFLIDLTVYSDGWVVDHPWMIKLFSAAGINMQFKVRALEYLMSSAQMEQWAATKASLLAQTNFVRHRASTDAEIIQKTYLQTLTQTTNKIPITLLKEA